MAKHLRINGVVQGVGYRATFAMKAHSLGLSGWVRNRSDGSVEALIHGPADVLDQMIDWAWLGPPNAQVSNIAVTEVADGPLTAAQRFEIRPTQ